MENVSANLFAEGFTFENHFLNKAEFYSIAGKIELRKKHITGICASEAKKSRVAVRIPSFVDRYLPT